MKSYIKQDHALLQEALLALNTQPKFNYHGYFRNSYALASRIESYFEAEGRPEFKTGTREYRVQWEIDLDAISPLDAAKKAREIQLDPKPEATVFSVGLPGHKMIDIDLSVPDENTPDFPRYNEHPYNAPAGIYLGLFHGRHSLDEPIEDWGFNGPMIGPLEFVHTTYKTEIKIRFQSLERARVYGFDETDPHLTLKEDCVELGGDYFGDWTVFYHDGEN